MQQLLTPTGTVAGAIGLLLCAASGLARVFGFYYLAGYESTTLFMAGMGLMVFACMLKLELLLAQTRAG